MSYKTIRPLDSPEKIKSLYPLGELANSIAQHREEIAHIIAGKDDRILLVAGPCSAYPAHATARTAEYLAQVEHDVKDRIKIACRVMVQKPRTNGGTYEGPAKQPDPYAEPDFEAGIEYSRSLMRRIATDSGLAIADEAVFVGNSRYFDDLLSYVTIGARSSEDPSHRQHASMLDMPVGLKNPTDGDIQMGVNAVYTAMMPAHMYLDGAQVCTSGNPHAHLILRGGRRGANYHVDKLEKAQTAMRFKGINPAIIVDASHDNCIDQRTGKKDYLRQPTVIMAVEKRRRNDPMLRKAVKGYMLECFLRDGSQPLDALVRENKPLAMDGLSGTDACLGMERTIDLIQRLYKSL